ncbi:MAG TPA: NUDIX domain-containing protein [Opitutaceae bacterium]|jgi:predicted NUDIX family phosphoesterase|nr:NUDIX domain-containing protein [Opitutaceae bacterium]
MSEKVLAVPRPAIENFLKQGFFESNGADLMGTIADQSVFLDRKQAEEDPSHKQIIPYILVTNDGRFLLYKRTKKQGESRLHNKLSLGFGGHINDIDGNRETDTNLILAAMIRELNEEVFIPSVRQVSIVGFINDDSNLVGKVHLGVAFVVEAANDRFVVNEPEMIEAKWCDAKAIEEIFPNLETWSQLLWTEHARPRTESARSNESEMFASPLSVVPQHA